MKTLISLLLVIVTLSGIVLLSSCGSDDANGPTPAATDDTQSSPADEPEREIVMLPSQELRIVSINVYLNNPTPRSAGLTSIVKSVDPDSIGVQEFMGDWVNEFESKMSDYVHAGYAHDGKENSRYVYANYIFYKKDKYNLIDHGILWLSETPTVPSGLPDTGIAIERRTCCWAILENKETGFRYVHVNCHLESGDEDVRLVQIPIVRDLVLRFESAGYPVFATGDFNAREGSSVYEIMAAPLEIDDPKYIAEDTMDMGSYNGFGDSDYKNSKPIDFCFVTGEKMTVNEYKILPTEYNGEYVSDHNAVYVRVTVDSLQKQTDVVPDLPTAGITYEVTSLKPYIAEFTFTQADDNFYADTYRVWAEDKDGNEIVVRTIPSKHLEKEVPATLRCTLGGLDPETEYSIYIAPMTVAKTYGNSISFTVTTPPLN